MSVEVLERGIEQIPASRREVLRVTAAALIAAAIPQGVHSVLAEEQKRKGQERIDISKLSANEVLAVLPEQLKFPDGKIATIDKCEAGDARQLLIVLRHYHPLKREVPADEQKLIDQSMEEIGNVIRYLRGRFGIRHFALEGFTKEESDALRSLSKKRRLTDAEEQELRDIRYELRLHLPADTHKLYEEGHITMLPGETEEVHQAALKLKPKLRVGQRLGREEAKIVEFDREDAQIELLQKSGVKVLGALWGAGHWDKRDNAGSGDPPVRVERWNLLNVDQISVAIVTPPTVAEDDEVLKARKGK